MLTIYKASAGSGKTYTLAKEYILQLVAYKVKTDADEPNAPRRYKLRQPGERAHRSILAITFSNQATDEMKSRIIEELAALADMNKESNYRNDFVKEYGFDAQRLAEVARQALQDLLFDFRFFNVSTIDSFFQGVIRSFAREIDLPGNYEVELNDSQAVGVAVAEMFQSLNDPTAHDKHLMRWIISYMNSKIEEGGKFNVLNRGSGVHSTVVMGLTKLMNEDYHSNAEKINDYFSSDPMRIVRFDQALAERKRILRQRFKENAQCAVKAANDYGLGDKTINSTIRDRMTRWAAGENYDPSDAARASLNNISPDVKGKRYYAAYFKGNEVPQAVDDAIVAMLAEAPDIGREVDNVEVIRRSLFLFGLLGHIGDFISDYRRDNNTILISDTNELLTRIMQDELTPFIYERMGVFLEHFLIDEFQDTSKMQWRNLRPLVLESLGNGNDNLIIGDEKQCIYRFRNSDPELLASIVKQDANDGLSHDVTVEKGNCVAENTNYRSTPNVVKFNNTLFPVLARQLEADITYANTVQSVGKSNSPVQGYVKIEVMDCAKKDDFTEKTLSSLAQEVRRQLEAGYRPKDIAVIVREHTEGQLVIDHLLRLMEGEQPFFAKRFDITSRGALKISSSPLVKLIISILRLIDTPEASTSERTSSAMKLAQLTTRFEYYFNREGLDATESLKRALEDDEGHIDRITRDAVTMRLVNLHSIVEHIIGTFTSREQRDAYCIFLSAFQDLVVDFCSRGQADVHSFLQWWDGKGHNELLATPDDLDALTVITAHASKGLQYKCVHIPFATWPIVKLSTAFRISYDWYKMAPIPGIDPELIPPMIPLENMAALERTSFAPQFRDRVQEQRVDNLNVFYVAATRAIDELIINTFTTNRGGATIGKCLVDALGQMKAYNPDLTVDVNFDGTIATVGSPLSREEKEKIDREQRMGKVINETLPMPPYDTTIRHNVWSLTRVDDLVEVDRARERGTFLHDVLSQVRRRSDLPLALRRRAHRVGLSAQQESEFLELLTKALDDKRVSRWFDSWHRVLNERTIDLDATERERPDRIVWIDDTHIEVVDYKFGEHHDRYFKQVRRYVQHLASIFPETKVSGYLWYPLTSDIVPVPDSCER